MPEASARQIILGTPFRHPHHGSMAITSGMLVWVRTAGGERVPMRALSGPVKGRDFPVVWVCTEDDYAAAIGGDESVSIPWPLNAVLEAEAVDA